MTDPLTPGPDAIARYLDIGEQGFLSFFEEIPAKGMRDLAELLPPIDGFRKGSPTGIRHQKASLARKLSRPHPQSRDLKALYPVWRTWIDAHMTNAKTVHELIDAVEEVARASSPETKRSEIERKVVALLETLKDESKANHCTREQIERMFVFSPFPETAEGRAAISAAKPADDLHEFSRRLQEDEDAISRLKSQVEALAERIDRATAPTDSHFRAIERQLNELKSRREQSGRELDDAKGELKKASQVARGEAAEAGRRIDGLAAALEELRRALPPVEARLKPLEGAGAQIERLAAAGDAHSQRAEELAKAVDTIRETLNAAEQRIVAMNDLARTDQVEDLKARLVRLEDAVAINAAQPPNERTSRAATVLIGHDSPLAGMRWDRLGQGGEDAVLGSPRDLARSWADALQSLGLKKSGAQIFAEECAAATLARQAVFLKGAFAALIARLLACAVGGGHGSARLSVPVGLQDGERVRAAAEQSLGGAGPNIRALVLEGINRSSLDIMEEVIADCATGVFGSRIAVFATLNSGFASLEPEEGYSALGAVFDLDCLDWRSTSPAEPAAQQGVLAAAADQELFQQIAVAGADIDEAIRLVACFEGRRNPSVERCFATAFRALQLLRIDESSVTALQSLFFGWVLPYWQSRGVMPDQMESELDGGKVNGAAVDPRLVALVKAGPQ